VAPHPAGNLGEHSCASIPNGIITIGGERDDGIDDTDGNTKLVYLYRNAQWSVVGQMQNVIYKLFSIRELSSAQRARHDHHI